MSIVLGITGCSEKAEFTLKGSIQGLPSDTLLVFYQIPEYKLDTIFSENGNFSYTFTPDTFTVFSLVLNEKEALPIYADKGKTVEIKGKVEELSIKGDGENKRLTQIRKVLHETPEPYILNKVDSFIRTDNRSFTNIYLIDKYYVQDSIPDYERMEELLKGLHGIIKDTPYMIDLQAQIDKQVAKKRTSFIQALSNKDREGKNFRLNILKNKYVLISFWASWHPESVAQQDSIAKLIQAFKKEDFVVVSVSLDYDKQAWMDASDRDTTQWEQLCDFKGWQSSIVKNQGIQTLPSNILLDTSKRIIGRNIYGKELKEKLQLLIEQRKKKKK